MGDLAGGTENRAEALEAERRLGKGGWAKSELNYSREPKSKRTLHSHAALKTVE